MYFNIQPYRIFINIEEKIIMEWNVWRISTEISI